MREVLTARPRHEIQHVTKRYTGPRSWADFFNTQAVAKGYEIWMLEWDYLVRTVLNKQENQKSVCYNIKPDLRETG
jgi:hypothetical protein